MKKQLLFLVLMMLLLVASADAVTINGINYNLITDGNIAEVVYPNSCSGSVSIPESVMYNDVSYSVTSIGNYAFTGCYTLNSITIPNSVTSIGNYAFQWCSFTSITIPHSVMSIGEGIFSKCSNLTSINVDANNLKYDSRDNYNVIIETTTNTLVAGCKNTVIPNSVTSIGNGAFAGLSFQHSITIPNGVISIGERAFYECSSLSTITIPNSVTSIGDNAFSGCSSLKTVFVKRETPINITSGVFTNRANATLYVPQGCMAAYKAADYWKEFKEIKEIIAFADENVKAICVANWDKNKDGELDTEEAAAVTYLGTVFRGNTTLTSFDELSYFTGLTSIRDGVFEGCTGLTSVTIPNSVTSIEGNAFENCSGLTSVIIPNSVTSIGNQAFNGCSGLTSISIPNSVKSIGRYAFRLCIGLTSVTIGNSVTSIDDGPFFFCSALSYINVDANNPKYDSRDNCNAIIEKETNTLVVGCGTTVIPNSVTSIGYRAFAYCSSLTSINIPNSVTSIGTDAFFQCTGLKKVIVPDIAAWCSIQFGGSNPLSYAHHLYSDDNTEITDLAIPDGVTNISGGLFSGCPGFISIIIPNSVTSIGEGAFSNCSSLTSINVDASNPKYDSRDNCNAIIETATNTIVLGCKKTVIPNDVTSIDNYTFSGCSDLTSITIPNSVTSIGNRAFSGCTSLTSITIPNSVTSIGEGAFSNCGLTSITIGNSVTSIGNYAFYQCSGLTSISIPNSVKSIGRYAFQECTSFTSITIPNSVTTIDDYAFYYCTGLTSVTIPNSVTNINYGTFSNCSSLTSVDIPNSVISIGNQAFYYCSSLTSINIPNSVTSIDDCAFQWCGLTSITIPNSVTNIGDGAFNVCFALTTVIIGSGIKEITKAAFVLCTNLADFYCYAESVPTTDDDIFYNSSIGNATLHVPSNAVDAYKAAAVWKDFKEIVALTNDDPKPTGIDKIVITDNNKGVFYDLNGRRIENPSKGLYIRNGKKVIMK